MNHKQFYIELHVNDENILYSILLDITMKSLAFLWVFFFRSAFSVAYKLNFESRQNIFIVQLNCRKIWDFIFQFKNFLFFVFFLCHIIVIECDQCRFKCVYNLSEFTFILLVEIFFIKMKFQKIGIFFFYFIQFKEANKY